MIDFKVGKHNAQLPMRWGELTFNQFYELRKDGDFLHMLSSLSGLDRKVWEKCEDIDIDQKISPYLDWMKSKFDGNEYLLPDQIEIAGKLYPRPKGIGLGTFGQKMELENAVTKAEAEGKQEFDVYAYLIALYMQPIVDGPEYDQEKVDKLVPACLEVRIDQGWPLASFFLQNYIVYKKGREGSFLTLLSRKRLEQELKGLEGSENFRLYSPLRRFTIKLLIKLSRWSTRLSSLRSSIKLSKVDIKRN